MIFRGIVLITFFFFFLLCTHFSFLLSWVLSILSIMHTFRIEMHEKLVERNFKCTPNPTFTSPSCRPEDYHLPVPTHSPTFLLPPACVLGMSRLTSIGGSMKPMPAGSSRADSGLCPCHRVLSAVHTEIVTIPLDCLVAFFKNWIFFFF